MPSIPGDNVVSAYGSYAKIGTARVKVTMCAKQTGTAFSVGAIALVYSASGDRILSEDAELTSDLLPGFRMPVKRLFEAQDE